MLNLKNNLIPTLNLQRQSILGEFNLLALALTPRGKPNSLKDVSVIEPNRRGLYRGAPCSYIHLAYSLCQLYIGISPPNALDPYS